MKRIILLIVIFILGGLAGYSIGWFQYAGKAPISSGQSTSPPSTSPTQTPTVKPTTLPSPVTSPSPVNNVNFDFAITDISGTGLSRTVTAQVTNTGSTDAHNAWAKVEVFSQGARIKLSNNDFLRVDIGIIKAGAAVTKQVTLQFSVLDGLKITQNGAQLVLTIYSDENTQTFNYDYKP